MSLRITGSAPVSPATLTRKEGPRAAGPTTTSAPTEVAEPMSATRAPLTADGTDQWEGSTTFPGAPPATAEAQAPAAVPAVGDTLAEAAIAAADRLREDLLAAPPRAARAHSRLLPATVLDLLA